VEKTKEKENAGLLAERSKSTASDLREDTRQELSEEELANSPFAAAFARAGISSPSELDRAAETYQEETSRVRTPEPQQTLESTVNTEGTERTTHEQRPAPTSLLGGIQARDTESLIEEVKTLIQRNSKPRKRALIQAALIGRGPEAMAEAKISEAEFPTIFQQIRLATQEAERGYDDTTAQELRVALRGVENMHAAIKASKSELAREYIGENSEDVQSFQLAFVSLSPTSQPPILGDADSDEDVDVTDYEIVKSEFGSALDLRADFNKNNIVDIFDYNVVVRNFNSS